MTIESTLIVGTPREVQIISTLEYVNEDGVRLAFCSSKNSAASAAIAVTTVDSGLK
jgi:hypothetical protein